jgi:cytidylate kinase
VATAAFLSALFLHRFEGVREGTVIAVFLVGASVRFFNPRLTIFNKLLPPEEELIAEGELPAIRPVIITISRQYYSGGHTLGERLSERLGWRLYDKEIISEVARSSGLSEDAVRKIDERAPSWLQDIYLNSNEYLSEQQGPHDRVFQQEVRIILNAARTGSCIIVGRLANFILDNTPNVISVFIHGSEDSRVKRMMQELGVTEAQALHEIRRMDANRKRFCHRRTGKDWSNADNYNLSFDSAMFTEEQMIDMILLCVNSVKSESVSA